MTLRADAVAAYQAHQNGRENDARTELSTTLTPEDVSALTVADVQVTDTFTRYVFTDKDLFLAVILASTGNSVHLVTGSAPNWTDLGTVDSLATLGQLSPNAPTPPASTGSAAWVVGKAYAVGDLVMYNGTTYKCVQAHTSQAGWEPPNVPALWSVA